MSTLQNGTILAAIGVTFGAVAAAGIFLYEKWLFKKYNLQVQCQKIIKLEQEVQALKLQERKRKRKSANANKNYALNTNNSTIVSTDNSIDIDTFSIAGTDIGDEFYDCLDDEESASVNESRESELINELKAELLKIDAEEKEFVDPKSVREAYNKLKHLAELHPDNVDVIWRFLRACKNHIDNISDKESQKKIIDEGLEACQSVLDVQNGDLHKWYATLVGINAESVSIGEKIKMACTYEKHLRLALILKPEDSFLHYLLGRYQYEIAGLPWLQRKMAAAYFSESLDASYEDAIQSFERAEQFARRPHLANSFYISQSYINIKEYTKGARLLQKICREPALTKDDENVQCESKLYLQKYSYYL